MEFRVNRDRSPENLAARFRATLQLHETVQIVTRVIFEMEHPRETKEQIDRRMDEFLYLPTGADGKFIVESRYPKFPIVKD